jgi:hypothetical protein
MGRIHLFELEDQSWCPLFIRESITDFLLGLYTVFNIYEPAYQKIAEVLDKTHMDNVIDCCSGSGGPIETLRQYLDQHGKEKITIHLTDKYPNQAAHQQLADQYPARVIAHRDSMDASALPSTLKGMRTFFSSFHHFTPQQAVKILQDAVNQNAPIGIFESTARTPADFLRMIISPILFLFIMPVAKKITWQKILFTYVLPIIPLITMWDYFVSNMRTYSTHEMQHLITQIHAPNYHWEAGKLWSKPAKCYVPYLIGYPRQGGMKE